MHNCININIVLAVVCIRPKTVPICDPHFSTTCVSMLNFVSTLVGDRKFSLIIRTIFMLKIQSMADISVQFLQRKGRAFGFPFTKSELEEYKKDVVGNALKFLTMIILLCI